MKKMVIALAGLLLVAGQLYAGTGDLIVDGMLGVGTTTPTSKLDVTGPISAKCGFSTYTADGLFGATATPVKIVTPHGQKFVVGYHDNGSGSYSPRIGFVQTYDAAISPSTVTTNASIGLEADGGLTFNYGANNAEGMRIVNTGNVGIGTADPGAYKLYVNGAAYSTGGWQGSDARFKKNLHPISFPLDKVLELSGHSYEWKTDEYKDKGFQEGRHYGVIAQEIEKVLPEVVSTAPDGTKAVAYTEIIPVLIEAIKEQQKMIEKQQSRIEALERMH